MTDRDRTRSLQTGTTTSGGGGLLMTPDDPEELRSSSVGSTPERERLVGGAPPELPAPSSGSGGAGKIIAAIAGVVGLGMLGFVGYSLLAKPGTSTTTTTQTSTITTSTTILDIAFVAAETRGAPMLAGIGNFDRSVVNIGEGKKWDGYKSKLKYLRDYLRKRMAQGDLADIVTFVDGSDVIWGGCDYAEFVAAYRRIVAYSGKTIVFSAEIVCGEQDCNAVPPVPDWAIQLSGGKKLNDDFWEEYVDGCQKTWTDECSDKRDCGGFAPCSDPPTVKFLNSGIIIGPVKDLSAMMEWSMDNYDKYSVWGDQSVLSQYWLDHTDHITLDYTGELVVCLSDMRWELLESPVKCDEENSVFLSSHRKYQLMDILGNINVSPNKTKSQLWKLKDAGDGKVFIVSSTGLHLSDADGELSLTEDSGKTEEWTISDGGSGYVFITGSQKKQLQDAEGEVKLSTNRQGWESWHLEKTDGTRAACIPGGLSNGIVKNYGFDRPQCLIHGNGRGFFFFKHIVKLLTGKTVDEVRNWGEHNSLHKNA